MMQSARDAGGLQSMTGFGSARGHAEAGAASGNWTWELRSVNAKGLDLRMRLPFGLEPIEQDCRRILSSLFSRGSISANLHFVREGGEGVPVVNEAALEIVLATAERLARRLGSPPPAAEAILQIRGVLEPGDVELGEEEVEKRNRALLAGLEQASQELARARQAEGVAIRDVLLGQVERIGELVERVENDPSRTPEAIRLRLAEQIALLLEQSNQFDPQRLHQEAVLLATKADLREEIDRLKAHIVSARQLLRTKGAVGRKLDFLAQEFNRETNTICSKSNAAEVTAAGLEMKVVIDQFREQIQNME